MASEHASRHAFFGVSALLFAASAAVTIVWCASNVSHRPVRAVARAIGAVVVGAGLVSDHASSRARMNGVNVRVVGIKIVVEAAILKAIAEGVGGGRPRVPSSRARSHYPEHGDVATSDERPQKGASQIKLAAGVPRSTLSTWPSSPSTRSKPHLIEDGPGGEV